MTVAAEDVAPVPLKRKEEDAKTVDVGKAVTLMNEEDGNAEETPELNENKVLVP